MPQRVSKTGSELFIVDNSDEDWKIVRYHHRGRAGAAGSRDPLGGGQGDFEDSRPGVKSGDKLAAWPDRFQAPLSLDWRPFVF